MPETGKSTRCLARSLRQRTLVTELVSRRMYKDARRTLARRALELCVILTEALKVGEVLTEGLSGTNHFEKINLKTKGEDETEVAMLHACQCIDTAGNRQ